ncbi:GNAT family N-acetyltransferase [Arthrobacter sp. NQ7]|uniref:GNAT family N-acetyltransferase n=1 Tax=Arthrobacter sp. NQ7 TaxID=3032303 RepID=UPI00240EECF7|nr:GNAT family N-acetyltransferase [Arthrobacter sp. NQ7]MDJ0457052.1 GNAT family N-acetyltransferase [Arthrobacter sp. NQ7]
MAASLISLAALIGPQDLKPAAHALRNIKATDLPPLAELYLQSYGDRTSALDTGKAARRIRTVLGGAHGTPIPQASLLTADAEGRIIAAILTTKRDFGTAGPGTAFIAELFTHPDHRRQGLAEELLGHALQALHDTGHKTVAVTVDSANAAAIALYLSRDFRRLTQPAKDK